jgi:hypothetical protein
MKKINLEEYKEEIWEMYSRKNFSLKNVAKELKVSPGLIRKNMVLWGLKRRPTKKRSLIKPAKDELEKIYYDKSKPLEEVFKHFNVGPTTFFKWLQEYNITPVRRFKYKKNIFSKNQKEKAYILGLVTGDIHARKHNRQISAELTSTHPAMINLFFNIFNRYGTPKKYLKYNKKIERREWRAYVLLDNSFKFMISDKLDINKEFFSFLAGFFDCEGCICIYNNHNKIGLSWLVYNSDKELLEKIKQRLEKEGFSPKLNKNFEKGQDTTQGYKRGIDLWALAIYSKKEVIKLMSNLPIKHREKIEKFKIVETLSNGNWESVSTKLDDFRDKLKLEVQEFIKPIKNEGSSIL